MRGDDEREREQRTRELLLREIERLELAKLELQASADRLARAERRDRMLLYFMVLSLTLTSFAALIDLLRRLFGVWQ